MPAPVLSCDVLLDFTNDTHDNVTIQLLQDYGTRPAAIVMIRPAESLTLILESGCMYQYAVKRRAKVANVTARPWRDVRCDVSRLFSPEACNGAVRTSVLDGVVVEKLWRDYRFCIWPNEM
ncbi:hypothetical protein FISHEDRAFT_38855 [Fistulina hepatica ATCC 64428]|uniref:Uncharacterized protein n=1 Tax=Fistulina hepatica ATCC 64428 TaxID=1128425 RepID=A0A0D7AH28_9AGAR|nr:hypothetical protein FISHEDRAFT_38855 [Fistulina hepatica ATCC 64428]